MPESLPQWLQHGDSFPASHGSSHGFVKKNVLALLSLLRKLRVQSALDTPDLSVILKLTGTLWIVLLVSLSRNAFFSLCIFALFSLRLCFLPALQLRNVLFSAFAAALFAACMLLPSLFIATTGTASPRTLCSVSSKVFLATALVRLLSVTTPWNLITSALTWFHVPDIAIFTLDMTLKYLFILGELCLHVLQAIQLRTVGRITRHDKLFSGVLGVTFLHAQTLASDTSKAMACRGFTGSYARTYAFHWHRLDGILVALCVAITLLFWYTQSVTNV